MNRFRWILAIFYLPNYRSSVTNAGTRFNIHRQGQVSAFASFVIYDHLTWYKKPS